MDLKQTLADISRFPVEDRIRLVEAIWDGIADEPSAFEPTDSQKEELARRVAQDDADPVGGIPWEDVKAEGLKRVRR